MSERRWPLWTVALLVAAGVAAKLADPARFAADLSATARDAGLPEWPPDIVPFAIWALIAFETALVVAIAVPRTSRAGLACLVGVMAAGLVLVGLASDWGRRAATICPCGIPFVAPFMHSGFSVLLVRDACIVVLVALAWPVAGPASARAATAGTG